MERSYPLDMTPVPSCEALMVMVVQFLRACAASAIDSSDQKEKVRKTQDFVRLQTLCTVEYNFHLPVPTLGP